MEPSEEESRNLLQTRGYVKASLSKLHKLAQPEAALQQYSVEYLKAKRERAQALFMEYDDYCRKITFSGYKDAEDETTENKYFDVVAALDEEINKRAAAAAAAKAAASAAVAQDKSTEHVSTGSVKKVTLPPIAIQTFSGKFSDYIPFINLFRSLIDNDKSLDTVQKMYYLRSFLKDEPFDLIKNLPLTGASYHEALELLDTRYNNRYKIISEHVAAIIDIKNIIRATAISLRQFVACIRQELAALKNLEPRVEYWDTILLCILSRKLDNFTARAYQLERDPATEPSIEHLLRFLEKRALALENVEQGHGPPASEARAPRVAAHGVTGSPCIYYTVAYATVESAGADSGTGLPTAATRRAELRGIGL
ncbi:uncharacterized protein [Choristoneura fumiferana]|uniref:uncharacterized protein n=1 Tax=Choristoneura fumiferana TaxID=7141 RepID=UPI003D15AE64